MPRRLMDILRCPSCKQKRGSGCTNFFLRMSVNGAFLNGKTVLDAGCGPGRLTRGVARYAREVVGMDFSGGAEEASARSRAQASVHIVQGDIMHPPFREACFDYVYSKGVLHYLPDVQASLRSLASFVEPGGFLSVTINPKRFSSSESVNKNIRGVTVRFPLAVVYLLSRSLVPFLNLARTWSGLKKRPIEWKERAHMIFKWLSCEHLNTAPEGQMIKCLTDVGFDALRISEIEVGITARKPDRS